MDALEKLRSVSCDPCGYALDVKARDGKPIVGYLCSYTPVEMIAAAGAVPFRLFGSDKDISLADAHLQSYCCSLARGCLEDALRGRLDFLDGAVFPHTCDTIQRLSDIWRLNAGTAHHFDVVLPVKLANQSSRAYMIEILNMFRSELEAAFGVKLSDERLRLTIKAYNRIRRLLKNIYEFNSRRPDYFDPPDIYHIMKAAMAMEKEELLDLLESLWAELEKLDAGGARPGRKRVILSGGVCSHPDIYSLISESGADVVWDDLCTGTRWFQGEVGEEGDPAEEIARRYMDRIVCPAKHMDMTARGGFLVDLVRQKQADGVVFLLLKFCDPHGFDYPYLKGFLDKAGVPSILLEVEEQLPSEGQLRTRFETFVDML